ncbi:glycosyl hydrolase family 8 [Serinibacter arcticus]|uniref:glycosyl hydrolase family 8 n=1 Tax=Serinibacter arcticus TaxID=1655435 RepID=UPI001304B3B1|nr:glycosyl hydrolase family 8 [Serinibacter arcticus]
MSPGPWASSSVFARSSVAVRRSREDRSSDRGPRRRPDRRARPGACAPGDPAPAPTTPAGTSAPEPDRARTAVEAGEDFLATYVDPDGRVVRHDQEGDTVSEGQAYGMLVAVGVGDAETFDATWTWTRDNLQRADGLLSWRWADGAVVDDEPASDADLDAARALVLAGERFDEPAYTEAATALGQAVLDLETAETALGRVLLAGPWADVDPYQVNPSYPSPVATRLLAELDGDPRWAELDAGSRAVTAELTTGGTLPPNWAQVHAADGRVEAMPGPDGRGVLFGYDAARTLVRYVESCDPDDHAAIAPAVGALEQQEVLAAELDLGGAALTQDQHPVTYVARAAIRALDGDLTGAAADLRASDAVVEENPTYFGAAWAALGRLSLETDLLGGCPPLAGDESAAATTDGAQASPSGTSDAEGRLTLQPRAEGVPTATGPQPIPAAGVVPTTVRIPEIDVTSALEDLVRDPDRVLNDPAVPEVAGWFSEGTVPGSVGPAVIAGHVDSGVEGAIFRDLDRLTAGSEVLVDLSDGTTATFRVTHAEVVPQAQFPTEVVYGPVPDAQLRLITCHTFDRAAGRYTQNLVVFATLVA